MTMSAPLLNFDGMLRGECALTIEEALDHATVDARGRVLIPILDVLALARVDADADVLLLLHADGSSHVLRIADLIGRSDVYLQLSVLELWGVAGTAWRARLRTHDAARSAPLRSIRAMTFATFVGLS
jgi:hypothetical protein